MKQILLAFAVAACALGCDSQGSVFDLRTPDIPNPINPDDFMDAVTNPLWPMSPGTSWSFRVTEPDGSVVTNEVEVLTDKRLTDGVQATVIWDRVFRDGEMIEETWDWYAQDRSGNVWYLGEETYEYRDGERVCACGAWESGVDGALAGIMVPADPGVGDIYYQEYYQGVAEDTGEILAVNQDVTVPAGTYTGCMQVRDTTPLDVTVLEHKYFCPGIGPTLGVDVNGGNLREELVAHRRP